jgi:hypothetical protein
MMVVWSAGISHSSASSSKAEPRQAVHDRLDLSEFRQLDIQGVAKDQCCPALFEVEFGFGRGEDEVRLVTEILDREEHLSKLENLGSVECQALRLAQQRRERLGTTIQLLFLLLVVLALAPPTRTLPARQGRDPLDPGVRAGDNRSKILHLG